jgi:hypothetical protein
LSTDLLDTTSEVLESTVNQSDSSVKNEIDKPVAVARRGRKPKKSLMEKSELGNVAVPSTSNLQTVDEGSVATDVSLGASFQNQDKTIVDKSSRTSTRRKTTKATTDATEDDISHHSSSTIHNSTEGGSTRKGRKSTKTVPASPVSTRPLRSRSTNAVPTSPASVRSLRSRGKSLLQSRVDPSSTPDKNIEHLKESVDQNKVDEATNESVGKSSVTSCNNSVLKQDAAELEPNFSVLPPRKQKASKEPPKEVSHDNDNNSVMTELSAASAPAPTPVKKRGRPRKNVATQPTAEGNNSPLSANVKDDQSKKSNQSEAASAAARRSGRQRKATAVLKY